MMPHHLALLARGGAVAETDASAAPAPRLSRSGAGFRNVHGFSELVSARAWHLALPLAPARFHAPRAPAGEFAPALKHELHKEATWSPPPNYLTGAGDPYNGGKLLSRIARTALIAEALGEFDLAAAIGANLSALVEVYAVKGAQNEWVWDETWGGLIGCGCDYDDCQGKCVGRCANRFPNCPSLADPGRDFGNGFYNDHHFHWGYHVYAAAVAAKFRPGWARAHRERLLLPARDIASPTSDGSFPAARHKDWYMMISWASGIALAGGMPYRQGRNQESTSEAVNGYYGVALLGQALGEPALREMGDVLLAMEVGARARARAHVARPPPPSARVTRCAPLTRRARRAPHPLHLPTTRCTQPRPTTTCARARTFTPSRCSSTTWWAFCGKTSRSTRRGSAQPRTSCMPFK